MRQFKVPILSSKILELQSPEYGGGKIQYITVTVYVCNSFYMYVQLKRVPEFSTHIYKIGT